VVVFTAVVIILLHEVATGGQLTATYWGRGAEEREREREKDQENINNEH
jgi:hypothetical protein